MLLCAGAFLAAVAAVAARTCFANTQVGFVFTVLAVAALVAAFFSTRAIRIHPNWPTAVAFLTFGLTSAIVLLLLVAALRAGSSECSLGD